MSSGDSRPGGRDPRKSGGRGLGDPKVPARWLPQGRGRHRPLRRRQGVLFRPRPPEIDAAAAYPVLLLRASLERTQGAGVVSRIGQRRPSTRVLVRAGCAAEELASWVRGLRLRHAREPVQEAASSPRPSGCLARPPRFRRHLACPNDRRRARPLLRAGAHDPRLASVTAQRPCSRRWTGCGAVGSALTRRARAPPPVPSQFDVLPHHIRRRAFFFILVEGKVRSAVPPRKRRRTSPEHLRRVRCAGGDAARAGSDPDPAQRKRRQDPCST